MQTTNIKCNKCGALITHLQKVCFEYTYKSSWRSPGDLNVEILQLEHYELIEKYSTTINIQSKMVSIEVESGSAVTLMNIGHFTHLLGKLEIMPIQKVKLIKCCKTA